MKIDQFIETLKSQLVTIGTNGVMTFLAIEVPFFAFPVVNKVTRLIVEKVIEIAIRYTELGAYFLYVDQYTAAQSDAFSNAAKKNLEAQRNGTAEQKKQAEMELINRTRDLIKFKR